MKKISCLTLAMLAVAVVPNMARADNAPGTTMVPVTTTEPTTHASPPSPTTVVVPQGTQVVVPPAPAPAPVVVEVPSQPKPRDAITGQAVTETPATQKEESLRDKVRDKMED